MESIYAIKSATGEILGLTTNYESASGGLDGLNPQYVLGGFPFTLIEIQANITELRQNSGSTGGGDGSIEVGPVETIPDPEGGAPGGDVSPIEDPTNETPKEEA